jgi:hypothetical protein
VQRHAVYLSAAAVAHFPSRIRAAVALAIEWCAPIPVKVRHRHATSNLQYLTSFAINSQAAGSIVGDGRTAMGQPTSHWGKGSAG